MQLAWEFLTFGESQASCFSLASAMYLAYAHDNVTDPLI